jgi:hypothetical protein
VLEGDLQAIGHESDKKMRLDAGIRLMINGPDRQVAFEFFEGLFDIPLKMPL